MPKTQPTVCIISSGADFYQYSETFIRAHAAGLPTRVEVIYGFPSFPRKMNGDFLCSFNTATLAIQKVGTKLLRLPPHYFMKKALKNFLIKNRIDVVLAEYGTTGVEVMDACYSASIPLVVHFHGYDAHSENVLQKNRQNYLHLFKKSAAIIAVSHDMELQLINLGCPRAKIYYNPCGVDGRKFQKTNPDQNPPTFAAIGRFVDKKGPHLTLLAFSEVAKTNPEARLVMVGEGVLLESCRYMALSLGLSNHVSFLGAQEHERIANILATSRAFVQHSLKTSGGDSEGTPVAVLEASATGLPVISTRHAGIKDIVIDGTTGYLVNEGDVETMAHYMRKLVVDPSLAAQLGSQGHAFVNESFSMEKRMNCLWSILVAAFNSGNSTE